MSDIMKMGTEPNYLGSWDLYDAPNNRIQVTISKIQDEEVVTKGKKKKETVCYFVEPYKPMILNATNKKKLSRLFKTKESNKFIGKRVEIGYEKVNAFGDTTDALRISNVLLSQQQQEVRFSKCESCGKDILPSNNMNSQQIAVYTAKKYGLALCVECAKKANEEMKKNAVDE